MKEANFLGTLILQSPLMFSILEKIREKYGIDEIDPTRDGLRERLLEDMENDQEIDWHAVRQNLEKEIRNIPDLLPPEVALFHKMIEIKNALPPEPTFTEPITDKLKIDVTALYHGYVGLYTVLADNLAAPFQTVIDNCYSAITDNALEFLYSGKIRDVPNDWISAVNTLPMFGEDIVMAVAGRLADPDEITQAFRQKLIKTFGKRRPKLTKKNLPFAEYLAMKLRRMRLRDIADEYILRHPHAFPKDPESPEYKRAKHELKVRLKQTIKRLDITLEAMIGDKIS